jgi:signal transduction histidine kinase
MTDKEVAFAVIFTTLIILLLVAGIVISVFMYRRQHLKQSIQLKQLELDFEKELREGEAAVASSVSDHISRELHDNIGQLLTVMNLQIETQKLDDPQREPTLSSLQQTLSATQQEVRTLSRTLNSDYISRNGIIHSIQLEMDRLKRIGKFDLSWEYDEVIPTLSKEQQVMAFRIFQEIINNALKHSGAKTLSISVKGEHGFMMEIKDDGKGFNYEKTSASSAANGLEHIKRRAELAGMSCIISSSPGQGCSYTINANTPS